MIGTMPSNEYCRVAIVGGGVTGLAAAWHLVTSNGGTAKGSRPIVIEIFESADRMGGHAWTVPVADAGTAVGTADGTGSATMVDIGFMVFNSLNYPNMTEWFQAMNVAAEASDMSLAVSLLTNRKCKAGSRSLEWSSSDYTVARLLSTLCTFITTLGPIDTYRFISDILRFNSSVTSDLLLLAKDDPRRSISIQQYLFHHQYSTVFSTYYLYPMMAALWSASMENVYNFPAVQVVSFLQNHQMLQIFNRPIWQTVAQRSETYVRAVLQAIDDKNATITNPNHHHRVHTSSKVVSVKQTERGDYQLMYTHGENRIVTGSEEHFQHVIFACHPPQTHQIMEGLSFTSGNGRTGTGGNSDVLKLLEMLSNVEYADNVIYVHSDATLMPKQMNAWSSWNCIGSAIRIQNQDRHIKRNDTESLHKTTAPLVDIATSTSVATIGDTSRHQTVDPNAMTHLEGVNGRFKAVYVTYWLNRLQNLQTKQNIFVSLNPHHAPDPKLTYHRVIMGHPQFTIRTIQARTALLDINQYQGKHNLWYCGAWAGYGFHEDGCRAGFDVATRISGAPLPWSDAAKGNGQPTTDSSSMVLPPPDLTLATTLRAKGWLSKLYQIVCVDLPVTICQQFIYYFLQSAIKHGELRLKFNDGTIRSFGDNNKECVGCDAAPVTLRIFDPWFFVKTAVEYDLGLARSYIAGYFVVEPLDDPALYHPVLRPPNTINEATVTIGDPVGLTRLFLLLIGNRDRKLTKHVPIKAGRGNYYSNAFTNASGLLIGKIGGFINYLRYKITMDNSERGGSLRNIHAHYDISNDLFRTFLDKETLMYSSAIYDAIPRVAFENSTNQSLEPPGGLIFRGTLEEAQWRKLDTLLARAQVKPGQTLLDIGFGWGGLSIHAAKKYGCNVTGITLSVEQKALAEERVKKEGLQDLITFEVIDYRTFARRAENLGKFDRVLSCEMIEAVGHLHLGEFFWAVERLLAKDGVLVMEAITTPEQRYETYIRSTDFINTIIFPGSCCPSLHALVDAAYRQSSLTLEHIDNIGLHYAQTLAEWRRRFNASELEVKNMGFDDVFLRAWNYYLTYCEAGFFSQTENCLILVFSRQGCKSLVPLCETRSVTQPDAFTMSETSSWTTDAMM